MFAKDNVAKIASIKIKRLIEKFEDLLKAQS